MALNATIFKAELQIADMDRYYYQTHQFTLAQHPSETDERMMVRLAAFALNASEHLTFSKGLCVDDEAELWQKSLSGDIELWIEFGEADEKWIKKACGRAKNVKLYVYGGRSVPIWWQKAQGPFSRYKNLEVWEFPKEQVQQLAGLVKRSMRLSCNISEGEMWLNDDDQSLALTPIRLY
ncbi:YaeQ family protein [Shewanella sp. NIFS-20-20]|uniref:YaeQ family protein n=1 Tax=Shewanella sp. NIFS-20-20 TaxID=2853806 RepID=UPI001C43A9E6|nr:YaeQ family protein [Shewanella sp. NIFS-20-20]MBV7314991.1 YaeQ family protein [Shewanella sp. NIFS-20-20]